MKGSTAWLIRIALVAVAVALMGADDSSCSTETTNEPDAESDSGSDSGGGGRDDQKVANIGDSITLKGTDTSMKVTVLKVIDPVQAGQFDAAAAGNRYVGIQLRLRNTGDGPYDDSPSNGAELLMRNDTQAESALVSEGQCSSDFGSSAKIGPGSTQVGCIPFEAKNGLRPKTFQFTLDSGFGPEGGEWSLR
jgi:hypothetical protein